MGTQAIPAPSPGSVCCSRFLRRRTTGASQLFDELYQPTATTSIALCTFQSAYSFKLLPKPGYLCAVLSTYALRTNLDTREEDVLVNYDVPARPLTKLDTVKSEHALHVLSGRANSNYIFTRLVNIYAFLGDISSASLAFNQLQNPDAYLWNSMVSAYVRNGFYHEAMECYRQFLLSSDVRPDFYTFPPLLKACRSLQDGQRLHCMVLKLGYEVDVFVSASLVHLYSRNGLLDIARDIFDHMPSRDIGSWNAMVSGYCQNESANETLDILYSMKLKELKMDAVTICSVLPMVAQLNDVLSGLIVHVYIIKHGLEFNLFVNNSLINMYAKLGHLADAQYVFECMVTKDVVSWNSIIAAYEQSNDPIAACWLFKKMLFVGAKPDLLTIVSLASAVAQVNSSQSALLLHCYCLRRYWLSNDIVIGNAVLDMYAKLGYLDAAKKVFDGLPAKDAISWNTLITGYTQNGLASEALEAYRLMEQCEYVSPNHGSWVNVLPACAAVGALKEGMKFHGLVTKNGLLADVFVGTCIVDMYGKCGRLDYAMSMFYKISRASSVPWNAMISCHGIHGHASHAVKLFEEMLDAGVHPDYITFVSLLSACSHAGLLDEGRLYFQMMKDKCGIEPGLKHYGCMVDLLGRAGYLEEAYQFIKDMPIRPDASVWGALLGACRVHGHAELGAFASERLFEVDSDNVGYYVLLSNIYASAGKWEVVDGVRSFTRNIGLRKTPGWSSIEVNNKVDVFYTGNHTHPKCAQIYEQLGILTERSKAMGYIPDFAFVLQDVEDDEKEYILTSHSERLAMTFGIISTPHRTPLHIFKNIRVCGDCHNFTKLISLITERRIIVRDANRFHHFEDGLCSCGDHW